MVKKQQNKTDKGKPQIIHCNDLASARRLFSRVLDEIQRDTITEKRARLFVYSLSGFVNLFRESEFEQRLAALEKIYETKTDKTGFD